MIHKDMEHLSRTFIHRSAGTDNEHAAAEYIRSRFREYTLDSNIEPFNSIDSYRRLFAAYYGEFIVVCLVSIWYPQFAFIYAAIVLISYLGELTGYRIMSRFMMQYQTQNVMARFLAPNPKRLLVIAANYDTPEQTPMSKPAIAPWIGSIQLLAVIAMVAIALSCAFEAGGIKLSPEYRLAWILRGIGFIYLTGMAGALLYAEKKCEPVHGSNGNATGVALLLAIAERLKDSPTDETDVWLVSTGAKEQWMAGMRHLIASHKFDKENTFFLVIDHVGGGELKYEKGEGMMHIFPSSKEMLEMAEALADEFGATPHVSRSLPSDALIPLARGMKTLRITAVGPNGLPTHWQRDTDTLANTDFTVTNKAMEFAHAIIRKIDATDKSQ